ncbi:MAG: cytochrome c biogenesis protein CcdA [Flavobacteriaceae bacterium]
MKKIILLLTLFISVLGISQQNKVQFSVSVDKLSDKEYVITYDAKIEHNWKLYSTVLPDMTGLPTEFLYLNEEGNYKTDTVEEFGSIVSYDPIFQAEMGTFKDKAKFTQKITLINPDLEFIEVEISYQTCDDKSCIPGFETFKFTLDGKLIKEEVVIDEQSIEKKNELLLDIKGKDNFKTEITESSQTSYWNIFVLGFIGGLIALLTPCVFPMIPLTVSFFTKRSTNRQKGISNAVLYGGFIVIIYLLLSLPFHLMDSLDPEILNNISTNTWLNIVFFIIFMFFAFSFFGYYEITLPSSWGNKMDNASNIGGIIGIFFMALTLAIVSFSCTGPILGSLLAGSLTADGGAMQLTAGMAGFGVALALPFALFALFPSWLNSLPKSGGWLNTVKVVLGFLELALALKFLSNADLVEGWGLIKRELFIGLWIVIFTGLALYLFGIIKFPHDSPNQKIGFGRKTLAVITSLFVLYMIPGLTNHQEYKNLKLLSGFPPPMFYSYYTQQSDCPLGLNCFKDWDEGLAYAKEHNKPILLDFTGWACVNCRKMEENVWSEPDVYNVINDNYVLISLYVDDRKELPEDKQFDFERTDGNVKKIKTIGDKWATFQIVNFQTASQPYYLLLSPDLEMLNTPKEYTDKADYLQWLKTGLENFKE